MVYENIKSTEEGVRGEEMRLGKAPWRLWGPYLSERQWSTVREDYSANGAAWEYFPHDHARSRAYRWGEDGIGGISDEKQKLCFAISLWNGKDSILKERLFGVTGHEGNHGEDVKEYYFYLDNIPSHAYMKYLYKYPQNAYPYDDLVETNKKRNRHEFEYELLDTGIFDEDRYYDVFVEYAKSTPTEIFIRCTIFNRGQDRETLYFLPTLWYRNTWVWDKSPKPLITVEKTKDTILKAAHKDLGDYFLYCKNPTDLLFTENETNKKRLFNVANDSPFVKDGINDYFIYNNKNAVNPKKEGTKASIFYKLTIGPKESQIIDLCLTTNGALSPSDKDFDEIFSKRKTEGDSFYQSITPYPLTEDMRNVQRQAFGGLLWNKQCYHYSVEKWLDGDPAQPKPPETRKKGRNKKFPYLDSYDVMSMPDKWEYPWFAAWDLAFHTISLAMIDPEFAKKQLILLTREWYMSPDGQIPAYEWNFSDVNPPVQAWAAMRVYQIEKLMYGREDREFLEKIFQKLVINFTWWVNRKDTEGRNIFEGGFLGLDNIGAFDRSLAPPKGGTLEQPDATGWMGMFCLNCLQIALELAIKDPVYEDMATKFFEHFVYIADAINNVTGEEEGLWDKEKGFYYGLIKSPDGRTKKMYQDNMTGIIPLFAIATNDPDTTKEFPNYRRRFQWFVENNPDMLKSIADLNMSSDKKILLSFACNKKLSRMLEKILDTEQFLSPFGIRSVSKYHKDHPFIINLGGREFKLDYEPAESTTCLFGGNSNWRGPIWFPLNFLLIESLQKFHYYFGDTLEVECPTGSGKKMNLWDVSSQINYRLISIFLKDEQGKRPVYGGIKKFQNDPHWKDYILFHEYFHGDNGAGLGASNQTGWTGLVAKLIHQYGKYVLQHNSPKSIEKEKIGHV